MLKNEAIAQTRKVLADGGMMQEGGSTDPVSGNDVPTGSLQEEVRDDVDAKLSVGEFVLPADVVRYIGLERLMKLRDEAKQGLARMDEVGQMGNAEEAPKGDEAFQEDDSFESDIDEIMSEVDAEDKTKEMAAGGFISGTDLTKASKNPAVDVRYFKNAEGRIIFITHINGKPMTAIPNGYTETTDTTEKLVGSEADKKAEAAKEVAVSAVQNNVGSDTDAAKGAGTSGPATPTGFTNDQARVAGLALSMMTGIPLLAPVVSYLNKTINQQAETSKADEKMSVAKTDFRTSELNAQKAADEAAQAQAEDSRQQAQESFRAGEIAEQNQTPNEAVTSPVNAPDISTTDLPSADNGGYGATGNESATDYGGVGGSMFAKGGFISKKAKPNVIAKSKKGLVSRK